ncbi:lymphotoxin-alpha-like isoform X2 [Gigantopelta aegis]|uniref:lymphotoxin-alpha-like isoform X2 n=1 Tax=Gigantopelta aegis TaxID=1735272 RepID=UPI001B887A7C|nr:lymphotoxin-alpha-like isoform X2 [Gigantopelta aegis]
MFPFRQTVAIFLMVTNVMLVSVVVYKTSQLYTKPYSAIFSNSVICHKATCKPGETCCDVTATNKTVNGSLYCCYDHYGKRIPSIMIKHLEDNYERDVKNDDHLQRVRKVAVVVNEDKTQQKPAAHLQMDPDAQCDKDTHISVLRWKSNGKRSFVKDGLTVVDEGIRVEKEGNYFIYSNVVFYGNQTKELDFARLCHYLYKRVPTTRRSKFQQLSSNPQSTCKIRQGKPTFATSYIGAVYHLDAGATVMVKTSSVERLVKQPQSTYFGIYMI